MATMKNGQKIGLCDQLLREICVGDEVVDAQGVHYTIDRYGRAKPVKGGNEVPVRSLTGCEIYEPILETGPVPEHQPEPLPDLQPEPKMNEEEKELCLIDSYVHAAGDQRLVDELRDRGWTVVCTKTVEKIIYEEVAL